jgi:MFS family permease
MTRLPSTFSALRVAPFRILWGVQLSGQLVTWTHNTTAAWILATRGESPIAVAAVTLAATTPFFLFGMLAGTIADVTERRRLMAVIQAAMVVVATATAVLSMLGALSTPVLVGATFLIGCGAAFGSPVVSSSIRGLVGRDLLMSAISLVSINANGARIAGPIVAGVLLTTLGATSAFALEAVLLLVALGLVGRWPGERTRPPAERLTSALRTGYRYVRADRRLAATIAVGALFVLPATSVWALLSLVAHDTLGLGADGFGVLFGCIGVGAISAALAAPALQRRVTPWMVIAIVAVADAGATTVLALTGSVVVAGAALTVVGAAWMLGTATIMYACQRHLPGWIRGRGIASWYTALFGSQALGSMIWGVVSEIIGVHQAFLIAAGVLVLCAVVVVVTRIPAVASESDDDEQPADAPAAPSGMAGPVHVLVRYQVPRGNRAAFVGRLAALEGARRRTGARRWRIHHTGDDPVIFLESFDFDSDRDAGLQALRRGPADAATVVGVADLSDQVSETRLSRWRRSDRGR